MRPSVSKERGPRRTRPTVSHGPGQVSSRVHGLPTRTKAFKLSRVSAPKRRKIDPDAPQIIGGRNAWYAPDGVTPITLREADALLGSTLRRRVALTNFASGYSVSTVFLVLDHNYGEGPPILWETMIFAPDGEAVDGTRYTSRSDAERGHDAAVNNLRAMVAELGAVLDGIHTD